MGCVALYLVGLVAFLFQFREGHDLFFLVGGFPSGQRVGEIHAGPFGAVGCEGGVEVLQGQPDLQVSHDEWRGHDLEAEQAIQRSSFHH